MELGGYADSGSPERQRLLGGLLDEPLPVAPDHCSPAGRRLPLSQQGQEAGAEKTVSFAPGCGAGVPPPSRRREEARVLLHLRRRLEACRLSKAPPPSAACSQSRPQQLDNRPLLLNKILSNRPLSVLSDGGGRAPTDWERSEFVNDCLYWHNVYRLRHRAPSLALCAQLCSQAQTWANHLAHANTFYYRNDRDIGQNLFCRPVNDEQNDVTGQEVSSYWYSANKQYNFSKEPDVLHANVNAGHFTQMVWASTRLLGVGKARSRSGKVLVVAHYRPPGNASGLFQQNVLPPAPDGSDAEMTSESGSESSASRSADYCS
ncbi:protein lon-1-like [Bacillus rossius redtenbacheri]|uniref:protein lon-1-like n=1 Tax=Bacillus rossius redtenbacheri TaxID=93214 RepID=UPI002FDDE1EF